MPVIELKIPNLGESISSVTFSKWLKPDGSMVALDEPLCEIETEKANQELSADSAGKLTWVAKEGEDLPVGALFAKIDTDVAAIAKQGSSTKPAVDSPQNEAVSQKSEIGNRKSEIESPSYATGTPSPAAAKILAEANVPPASVSGTGRDGRITKEDALKASPPQPPQTGGSGSSPGLLLAEEKSTPPPQPPQPPPNGWEWLSPWPLSD